MKRQLVDVVREQAATELDGDMTRVVDYIDALSNHELLALISRAIKPEFEKCTLSEFLDSMEQPK